MLLGRGKLDSLQMVNENISLPTLMQVAGQGSKLSMLLLLLYGGGLEMATVGTLCVSLAANL